ncbi:MAG: thiamine pyrophosphate enzyme binding domain protein [Xanthobacteraceae bacterium]|nr:thiamine pyrophosphate enzyme binding domain protein [Xanthobacteraceae bacterium]
MDNGRNDWMDNVDRPDLPEEYPLGWKSDVAAEMLRRLDVPYVALNPGASYRGFHDSLVNYLGNRTPQMIVCLHEDHVVAIAHGYAKATDKPMGAILHSNVGLMHGLMGLFNAFCDRVPMIVIGATGPVAPEKRRPWIDWIHTTKDQASMLRNYIKWDDEPRSVDGVIEAFLRGYQLTVTKPSAPVYICLDAGLQEESVSDEVTFPDVARYSPMTLPAAPAADVCKVAEMVAAAKSPVFMFGRGSREQLHWDARVELAELAGASVMSSQRERAAFPTQHGLHVVPPMGSLSPAAKELLAAADLIVSFDYPDLQGTLRQVNRKTSTIAAKIVRVSVDHTLHNGWSMDYFGLSPADLAVMADPDAFTEQLLHELSVKLKGVKKWDGKSRRKWETITWSDKADQQLMSRDIEVALAEVRGDRKFTLTHLSFGWAGSAYHWNEPLDYLGHDGGAGLSAGPGLTLGASLALKDKGRTVICVDGDGDFMQGATALWTAAHHQIPALFIINNNRSNFNDEIHQEAIAKDRKRPIENKWIGMRISEPDVDMAGLARAQGVEAEGPITNRKDLLEALERGLAVVASGKPYLIDVVVKPSYANKLVTRGD